MTNRSVFTVSPLRVRVTRSETLPAVHTTRPQRGSSACSAATFRRVGATASRTSASNSDRTIGSDDSARSGNSESRGSSGNSGTILSCLVTTTPARQAGSGDRA